MKVLYIGDRRKGGIEAHVRCLQECLRGVEDVETYSIGGDEPFAGRNGHDLREWFQIRRVIRRFRPDIVHFHTVPLLMGLYVRLFAPRRVRIVSSGHMIGPRGKPGMSARFRAWLTGDCYHLTVSTVILERLRECRPQARGEVFFNSVKTGAGKSAEKRRRCGTEGESAFVVGMVGRHATVKDWPSYCSIARLFDCSTHESGVRGAEGSDGLPSSAPNPPRRVRFWGVGVSEEEAQAFGEVARCVEWKGWQANGSDWIVRMDLFLMTSVREAMPTTVLECFRAGIPVCGFVPEGGMSDILSFSNGALREVFVDTRDCGKLAEIVRRILKDADLRRRLAEDGRQILERHFDAEKNCRGQLMDIYRREILR